MSAIVIVCARGGSKGIPWKNLRSPFDNCTPYEILRDKINQSNLANLPSYISSDSSDILEIASRSSFTPIRRPDNLAHDNARLVEVLLHAKEHLSLGESCQVIQISPVAPFISIESLNKIYEYGMKPSSPAAISVTPFSGNAHPSLAGELINSKFNYILDHNPRYPRQRRANYYYPNGCLFSRHSSLIQGNTSTNDLPDKPSCVIMNAVESINLDDMNDWKLALSIASALK